MAQQSSIEWTDSTWNPVTGCTKVSPGCDHCYAETFAERFRGVPGHHFERGFNVTLRPDRLMEPARWRGRRRVFVNSMSDLFHRDVPDDYIAQVFDSMRATPQHTYQVLTKRPERMRRWVATYYQDRGITPPTNIWLGVSVESIDYAWRSDMLRETPAALRFLSLEPLLGPLDDLVLDGLDWIIVGGESGPGARRMDEAWVISLRDRAQATGVAFFFKQWGGVHKKRAGRTLGGRTWDEMPRPQVTTPRGRGRVARV
jgi:protein gp37